MPFNPQHYRKTWRALGNPTDPPAYDVVGEFSAISLLKGIFATAGGLVPDHSISFAKLQQVVGPALLGRGPANLGDIHALAIGNGLQVVGGNTLAVSGVALTSNVNMWTNTNTFAAMVNVYDGNAGLTIRNVSDSSKRLQWDLSSIALGTTITVHAPTIGGGYLALLQSGDSFAQPLNSDLNAISALTGTDVIYYRSAPGVWSPVVVGANLTFSAGTLSATGGGGGSGSGSVNPILPVTAAQLAGFADATGTIIKGISVPGPGLQATGSSLIVADDLAALENLTGTNTVYYRSGTSVWSAVTMSTGLSFAGGTLAVSGALAPLAGLSPSADTVPYFTGPTTAGLTAFSSYGRSLVASANAGAALSTLGAQPADPDLTALSGLTGTNTIYYRSGDGIWTPVTIGANLTFTSGTLAATGGGGVFTSGPVTSSMLTGYVDSTGNLIRGITLPGAGIALSGSALVLANDLSALEALTGTNTIYYRSGVDAWSPVTIGTGLTFAGGALSASGGGGGVVTSGSVTASMLTGYADSSGNIIRGVNMPASGIALSSNNMVLTNDLASLEAASATGAIYYRSAADTWSTVTVGGGLGFSTGNLTVTNAALTALATLTPAADQLPYFTGATTAGLTTLTSAARGVLNQASVSAMLSALGGQPLDGDLTSLAGATGTNAIYYRSAADTWSPVTIGANLTFTGGTLAATGGGGSATTISDTPPGSPTNGSLWFESDTGTLWISYNDGTSTQWVSATGGGGSGNVVASGGPTSGQLAQWISPTTIQGVAPVLVQKVYAENTTFSSITTSMSGGTDTIPQQTDGTQILSVSITPKFMSSRLHIDVVVPCSVNVVVNFFGALFRDSTANALAAVVTASASVSAMTAMVLSFEMPVASLASTTFKFRVGTFGSGTININGAGGNRQMGGVQRATISIEEYSP